MENASKNTYLQYLATYLLLVALVFGGIFWKLEQNKKGSTILSIAVAADLPEAIQLFYRSPDEMFDEENMIIEKIGGKRRVNNLVFKIPTEASHILLGVSRNGKQKNVLIDNISVKDYNREKSYKGQELLNKFKPNKFISNPKVEGDKVVLSPRKIDKAYNPYFQEIAIEDLFN